MEGWWAPALAAELSQGDLLAQSLVGIAAAPPRFLSRGKTQTGSEHQWVETQIWQPDSDGLAHYLARGRFVISLVLSHNCELDKAAKTGRVLLAPVFPTQGLVEKVRQTIVNQQKFAFMPVPEVPSMGVGYADLRCIVYASRKTVDGLTRLKSMSDLGTSRLQAQIIGFFSRIDVARLQDAQTGSATTVAPNAAGTLKANIIRK